MIRLQTYSSNAHNSHKQPARAAYLQSLPLQEQMRSSRDIVKKLTKPLLLPLVAPMHILFLIHFLVRLPSQHTYNRCPNMSRCSQAVTLWRALSSLVQLAPRAASVTPFPLRWWGDRPTTSATGRCGERCGRCVWGGLGLPCQPQIGVRGGVGGARVGGVPFFSSPAPLSPLHRH